MRSFFTSFARNIVFANIVLLFIFSGGYLAIRNLSRENFPNIELDMVRVAVVWPGADPEEVEEGVSRLIEEALDGLEGIREFHTISNEHAALAVVEVMEGYDVRRVKEEVRNAVDAIANFPLDAERPVIQEFIIRMHVMTLSVTGPALSDTELREYAEHIRDEVRDLPEVTQVSLSGARAYEIAIEISEERLREYGITFEQVAQVVRANSLNVPGGVMRTEGEEIRLRTVGRNYTGEEFSDLVVLARPDGQHITLGRIAEIRDGLTEETTYSWFNGEKVVNVSVYKTKTEDTLVIDRAVMDYVKRKQAELPDGVTLTAWSRRSLSLEARINLLIRNGIVGLTVVFILLWLFLDIRLSFWAGLGMPVSIMGAFIVMWYFGATINMMTLFGMITVLGIIVDDAIVVGEAIYVARKKGHPAVEASVEGVLEVGMPVIAAVTTTIVAFMPLFFVAGILGRLIIPLPMVVVAALSVSLIECLFLLPAHLNHLPDPNARTESKNIVQRLGLWFHNTTNLGLERFVERYYNPVVALAIRWRYISLCIAVAILFLTNGIMDGGYVKFVTFPEEDGNNMAATIEFPGGTPLDITEEAVKQMEAALHELAAETKTKSGDPLVNNIYTVVGSRMDDRGVASGSHVGSVRVDLLNTTERDVHVETLKAAWEQKIGMITGAVALTITGGGGPGSKPLEIWLQGRSLDSLIEAAEDLKEHLTGYAGVYQIQDDYRIGPNEIKLSLRPEARALGVNVADLAFQIYTSYYGQEAVRVQRGRNDVRVRVRYPEDERQLLATLENMRIRPMMSMAMGMSSAPSAMMLGGGGGTTRAAGMGGAPGAGSTGGRAATGSMGAMSGISATSGMDTMPGAGGTGKMRIPGASGGSVSGRSGAGGTGGMGGIGGIGGSIGGIGGGMGGMGGGMGGIGGMGGMGGIGGGMSGMGGMGSMGGGGVSVSSMGIPDMSASMGMGGMSGTTGLPGIGGLAGVSDAGSMAVSGAAIPSGGGMGGMGGARGAGRSPLAGVGMSRSIEVPLLSVADIEYTSGATSIQRTNGQRKLVVSADVNTEIANAREIIDHINSDYFPNMQARYHDINMAFKGDHQMFRDAVDSLYISFPLAIIGIFIIVATVFRSYVQPLVILVTVPFGISGAIFGHLLLGYDLTMMSVFGLVALAGVVVNDAIVLIECINNYVANGESFYEAVRRGGARRFRAIFLTSITTVGGLAPMIAEQDRTAKPLIPMAITIAAGIIFATLLTLFLVPALMCILNDMRRLLHFMVTGTMPSPEDVEPARLRKLDPDA